MIFFFHAEAGIRDLLQSRGLGDVFKSQVGRDGVSVGADCVTERGGAVSYKLLTLPTIIRVEIEGGGILLLKMLRSTVIL